MKVAEDAVMHQDGAKGVEMLIDLAFGCGGVTLKPMLR